jgi:hypothetical protein
MILRYIYIYIYIYVAVAACVFKLWAYFVRIKTRPLRKNGPFFECFPYVCPEPVLANSSFCIYQWLKKTVFAHPNKHGRLSDRPLPLVHKTVVFFECFSYVCPEPVLVK